MCGVCVVHSCGGGKERGSVRNRSVCSNLKLTLYYNFITFFFKACLTQIVMYIGGGGGGEIDLFQPQTDAVLSLYNVLFNLVRHRI